MIPNLMKNYIAIAMLFSFSLFSINLLAQDKPSNGDCKQAIATAQQALAYIEKADVTGFKSLMNGEWLGEVTDEQLEKIFEEFKYCSYNYNPPADPSQINVMTMPADGDDLKGTIFVVFLRYVSKKDVNTASKIAVTVSDSSKIMNVDFSDLIRQRESISAESEYSHLDSFNLQFKDISWFRVLYNNGYRNNKNVDGKPYYAVTGGKFPVEVLKRQYKEKFMNFAKKETKDEEVLKQIEISADSLSGFFGTLLAENDNEALLKDEKVEQIIADVFRYVNEAKVDSIDYQYYGYDRKENPENVTLRVCFNNDEYKDLTEFIISCKLSTQTDQENLSDYIILVHSEQTRYLLSKAKNPKLFAALRRLADYDWGDNYEENP